MTLSNFSNRMIKGGALYYAIFVCFIITLFIGFIILATFYFNRYVDNEIFNDQLKRNVHSGINLVLSNPDLINYDQVVRYDLYNEDADFVKLEKRKWGLYDIIRCQAQWKAFSYQQTALFGEDIFSGEPVALYLADKSKYISLSGEARIEGDAYLPRLGIKRAHIEGKSYTGEKIVYGQIKTSDKILPTLDRELIQNNLDVFENGPGLFDDFFILDDYLDGVPVFNSFGKRPLVLYSKHNIQLIDEDISGNVVLIVDGLTEIYPGARLKDILIYSRKAGIADGFEGNLQLFVTDSLIVGSNVSLDFPSGLTIINTDLNAAHIFIGNNSRISGSIIIYNKERNSRTSDMILEEGVIIDGQVYCDGLIEHKGRINGMLYCQGFKLKTPAAYYENHLLDAQISFTELSKHYVGCALLGSEKGQIIRWLN